MCDLIPGTLRKSSFRAIYVQGYLKEGFHNNICASSNYENRKSLANKCHRFCIKGKWNHLQSTSRFRQENSEDKSTK